MSFNDVYEFIQGEYQQVTRIRQEPVSTADPVFFKDLNLVKWAGFSIEIWSAETGGTQLVQGLDYELQYLDVSASGPAGEPVYSGYDILTPLYYNIPLYQTANIVGAYTTRPYRPSYNVITADTTVTPASMDDSVIADATGGSFTVTIADGFHLNQRYSIICKGLGTITVVGTGISAASFTGVGVSWLWDGNEWMPLAAPGAREGGIYYDWELVYTNEGAPSTTIPNVSSYGEGLLYAGVEFTYGGESVRASGTFALYGDGIDRYTILANDVSGSDSTMNLRYDSATDTLEAVETGSDFTNINLFGLYHWTEFTYGGYGAWANTAEAPPYGEAITSEQELYLDGTKEFVSSDGNAPVVDVVDYLPAVINVDGSETPEANSKWPGQRGAYGFFGEYENLINNASPYETAVVIATDEGDWIKVEASTTDPTNYIGTDILASPLTTLGFYAGDARRGNTDVSVVLVSGISMSVTINWLTKLITTAGCTDVGSFFIDDNTVHFSVIPTTIGGTSFRAYASNTAPSVGDYTYYKNLLGVDLPYAVPYVAGTHQPAKLQYSFNWAESTEWTIQGWFKLEYIDTAEQQVIVRARIATSSVNYWEVRNGTTGDLELITNDGAATITVLTGYIADSWNHIKLSFTSTTSIAVYMNGGTAQDITLTIPSVDDIPKVMAFGSNPLSISNFLQGYAQDWTIQPGIDTSDAHYLSGLPHYNPNKTYGKNASWSIDSRGNISGNTDAKDWQDVWSGSSSTVLNSWGIGKYILQVDTTAYGAAMEDPTTATIEVSSLSENRQSSFIGLFTGNLWVKYDAADNSFKFNPTGSYFITKISRWQ